jgi:putative ABC transport system permease protein
MALGAAKRQVLGQILREGMTTALTGAVLGATGAAFVGRMLQGTIYGVDPSNPLTFVAISTTLFAAAFLACLVPACRAASVNPMTALRQP